MLLIGWCKFPMQHDQSEVLPRSSSVWNFCGGSVVVIFQGNQWWCRKMLANFSGYWVCEFSGLGRKLNRSGFSFGYIFVLFPVKIPLGYAHKSWGNRPGESCPPALSDSLVWIDVELFLEPREMPIIGSRTSNKLNTVKDLEIWYHWWYISVTSK